MNNNYDIHMIKVTELYIVQILLGMTSYTQKD
jgi:hypothetical protein